MFSFSHKGGVTLTSLVMLVHLLVTSILKLFNDGTTVLKMVLFYEGQTKWNCFYLPNTYILSCFTSGLNGK